MKKLLSGVLIICLLYGVVMRGEAQVRASSPVTGSSITADEEEDLDPFDGVVSGTWYKKGFDIEVPLTATVRYKKDFKSKWKAVWSDRFFELRKNGIYEIKYDGDSVIFGIDSVRPYTNVKSGKKYRKGKLVKVYDSLSGVKKVTLNGKKVRTSFKLKKKGRNKVCVWDRMDNKLSIIVKVR